MGDIMKEIWKDIPNFKGYQVSNLGNIRTYNKVTYTKTHGERHWENRILKQKITKSTKNKNRKDCRVDLWENGRPHTLLVARLVAFTFNEVDLYSKLTVNHIDGNSLNNNLSNLEIITRKENIQHAFNNGLMPYNEIKVIDKEKKLVCHFRSMSEASKFIEKNHGYISNQIKKNKYENNKYKWEILERY